jgi:hypothetical protein
MNSAKMVYTMVIGLFLLLGIIIIGDFYISIRENKPPDDSVIVLAQNAIVGFIGVISGWFAREQSKDGDK